MRTPKSFCLYGFYLPIYTIFEIKTEKNGIYKHKEWKRQRISQHCYKDSFDFRDPRPHFENYYSNAILNTPLTISPLFFIWPVLLSGKFFPISAYKNPSKLKCLTLLVRSSPSLPSSPIAAEPSLKRPAPCHSVLQFLTSSCFYHWTISYMKASTGSKSSFYPH